MKIPVVFVNVLELLCYELETKKRLLRKKAMKYKLMVDEKLQGTKYFLAYYKRDCLLNVDVVLTGTFFMGFELQLPE